MMKKHKVVLTVFLIAAVVLAAAPVPAQEKAADNMQIVLEKARADKKLLVAGNMQLTEAEGKVFWPVYERYQDELFLLRARTLKLLDDYADSYEKLTNEMAKKLLDEYMTIETLRLKLHQAYLPKFRKALPDKKVARYYQIENKVQAALMYEFARKIPLAKTDG
ncbi:hypothetical protein [Syntrophobacter fumaroxidans]|uniref:Uncharacterized protein n=1 Tax=Syntrophobacter fumaroxidans (strain DSM 10017 / MPOB) TaxID=335543 RepID=A0LFT7_SYNFM|nr:hypothetical protein [Syntrophobacter fumaroxidans]ABK16289.1 conserved hypothetical protein [Syntrophobacter fumaroxidans MPOB]